MPKRPVIVRPVKQKLVVIASDAQADTAPSAGAIVRGGTADLNLAYFGTIPQRVLDYCGYSGENIAAGGNPIALCEAAVVLTTLVQCREQLKGQKVIWFVDNSVAVSCFAKGASKEVNVTYMVAAFHMVALLHDVHVWFEFVKSEDNWADGVSRKPVSYTHLTLPTILLV